MKFTTAFGGFCEHNGQQNGWTNLNRPITQTKHGLIENESASHIRLNEFQMRTAIGVELWHFIQVLPTMR